MAQSASASALSKTSSDIVDNAALRSIIVGELRETYGIKYRKDKKAPPTSKTAHVSTNLYPLSKCVPHYHNNSLARSIRIQKAPQQQRLVFNVALDKLELTDVRLANGTITQVPLFVSDACERIIEQVTTEGLFRKAGSTARQREIRVSLRWPDNGDQNKQHTNSNTHNTQHNQTGMRRPISRPAVVSDAAIMSSMWPTC